MRAAFATRGFARRYAGLTASMLGDSLMLIVLSMWVKSLTGSNAAAGLTFLWLTAPALLAPLFGYVVDRIRRRPSPSTGPRPVSCTGARRWWPGRVTSVVRRCCCTRRSSAASMPAA